MYTVVASARTRVRTGQRMLESLNEVSILWSVSKGMYDKRAHTSFFNDSGIGFVEKSGVLLIGGAATHWPGYLCGPAGYPIFEAQFGVHTP